jgi:hypothetical protein
MTWHSINPRTGPTPEQLSAYADGELPPADRALVEAWLADHPADSQEVDSTRRLTRAWRACHPPEPRPDAWARTLDRIHAGLPAARPGARRRPLGALVALLAAAAVLAGVLLARPWQRLAPPAGDSAPGFTRAPPAPDEPDEPFPVAEAHEVDILHMNAEDADRVAMGQPVLGALEFAAATDIRVLGAQPHQADGPMPRLGGDSVPMIVTPGTQGGDAP